MQRLLLGSKAAVMVFGFVLATACGSVKANDKPDAGSGSGCETVPTQAEACADKCGDVTVCEMAFACGGCSGELSCGAHCDLASPDDRRRAPSGAQFCDRYADFVRGRRNDPFRVDSKISAGSREQGHLHVHRGIPHDRRSQDERTANARRSPPPRQVNFLSRGR